MFRKCYFLNENVFSSRSIQDTKWVFSTVGLVKAQRNRCTIMVCGQFICRVREVGGGGGGLRQHICPLLDPTKESCEKESLRFSCNLSTASYIL